MFFLSSSRLVFSRGQRRLRDRPSWSCSLLQFRPWPIGCWIPLRLPKPVQIAPIGLSYWWWSAWRYRRFPPESVSHCFFTSGLRIVPGWCRLSPGTSTFLRCPSLCQLASACTKVGSWGCCFTDTRTHSFHAYNQISSRISCSQLFFIARVSRWVELFPDHLLRCAAVRTHFGGGFSLPANFRVPSRILSSRIRVVIISYHF